MRSREDRINALEERLMQLKNCQQRADARRRHLEDKRHRRADLRRTILVAAAVLDQIEQGRLSE
jgi:hypothetical protein